MTSSVMKNEVSMSIPSSPGNGLLEMLEDPLVLDARAILEMVARRTSHQLMTRAGEGWTAGGFHSGHRHLLSTALLDHAMNSFRLGLDGTDRESRERCRVPERALLYEIRRDQAHTDANDRTADSLSNLITGESRSEVSPESNLAFFSREVVSPARFPDSEDERNGIGHSSSPGRPYVLVQRSNPSDLVRVGVFAEHGDGEVRDEEGRRAVCMIIIVPVD